MTTRLYVIMGHPVGQVRSPLVFNARFADAGRDAVMVPVEAAPDQFRAVLDGLLAVANLGGVVATVPHKQAAAAASARRSGRVELLGAANVLRPTAAGWESDLFDGVGFVNGLRTHGHRPEGRIAAVLGAGGAGLAISEALLSAGASVTLSDKDSDRAAAGIARLAERFGDAVQEGRPAQSHDLVVNATPVGMNGDTRIPIDLDALQPGALVADAIMKPPVTPLLQEASRRGHPTIEGRHMLDGQAQAIWDFLGMGD